MTGLAAETTADLALLNPVELARRDSYVFAADRSRFTLGVALSRRLAGRMLGVAPAQVNLDRSCVRCGAPHGKPALPGTGVHLSISHSADLVAVAITRAAPVGLDVELIDPARRAGTNVAGSDLASSDPVGGDPVGGRRFGSGSFSSDQRASDADFFRTWCRTEAVVKATGDGLRVPPEFVIVSPPHKAPRLLAYPRAIPALQLFDLDLDLHVDVAAALAQEPDLEPGYAAALAILTTESVTISVHRAERAEAALAQAS
ncbi:MAG: 4-phosphopantetheinyl transferase [Subtercola sp.]|nr:4-phosphopantetheinyl transferase [Subtercola sp.]